MGARWKRQMLQEGRYILPVGEGGHRSTTRSDAISFKNELNCQMIYSLLLRKEFACLARSLKVECTSCAIKLLYSDLLPQLSKFVLEVDSPYPAHLSCPPMLFLFILWFAGHF